VQSGLRGFGLNLRSVRDDIDRCSPIHDYLGVDLNLVADVVALELPAARDVSTEG
jgi:uncharacterized protein with HEPN domain